MKKRVLFFVILLLAALPFSGCSAYGTQTQNLANLVSKDTGRYTTISWEDRTYVPYCVASKSDCGKQIGILDGDSRDKIYELKNYPSNEWIINAPTYDSGAILYREITVTNIPTGFVSEYNWN